MESEVESDAPWGQVDASDPCELLPPDQDERRYHNADRNAD